MKLSARPIIRRECAVVVVGAGAGGLMAAIQAGRAARQSAGAENTPRKIIAVDSARTLGAKILVAGGGRCNVTHQQVSAADYTSATASKNSIRNILRRFTVDETIEFFAALGVKLKCETTGKLFPITNSARTVLDALLRAATDAKVEILTDHPVDSITMENHDHAVFNVQIPRRNTLITAEKLILATGGKALPKTGSDGHGYKLAQALKHSLTKQIFPALVPLTLPQNHFLCQLQGIAHQATFAVHSGRGKKLFETTDDFLCTHFGLSGPAILDISRHYRAATFEDPDTTLRINFIPGLTFHELDQQLQKQGRQTLTIRAFLRTLELPERLARGLGEDAGLDHADSTTLAQLKREERRQLARTLTEHVLPSVGQRGFRFAEVTAGGIPLPEVNGKTLESKLMPGLYFCGEILDVDGRIGGFNFQWAWTTGTIAGRSVFPPPTNP